MVYPVICCTGRDGGLEGDSDSLESAQRSNELFLCLATGYSDVLQPHTTVSALVASSARPWESLSSLYEIAFVTSLVISFFTESFIAVTANEVGQNAPSSSFAASWKPNVE